MVKISPDEHHLAVVAGGGCLVLWDLRLAGDGVCKVYREPFYTFRISILFILTGGILFIAGVFCAIRPTSGNFLIAGCFVQYL